MRVVPLLAAACLVGACTAPVDQSGCSATRATHELRQLDRQIAQVRVASRNSMTLDLYGYGAPSTYSCTYRGSGSVVCDRVGAGDYASRASLDALVARQQSVMAQVYSCQMRGGR